MNTDSPRASLFREWSALVPIGMSLASLALVLISASVFGTAQNEDEGAAARIFQLLMTLQMPIVAYFAVRWLPKRPRPALLVLVVQGIAWLAALGVLFVFEHP
jgi:hypothetical protein